uniref:(northern house mosquito) hypothetical protein n=1 Tax=Culex pipiens TaxID=7175 RepID=A0A8D8C7I3_CULPI
MCPRLPAKSVTHCPLHKNPTGHQYGPSTEYGTGSAAARSGRTFLPHGRRKGVRKVQNRHQAAKSKQVLQKRLRNNGQGDSKGHEARQRKPKKQQQHHHKHKQPEQLQQQRRNGGGKVHAKRPKGVQAEPQPRQPAVGSAEKVVPTRNPRRGRPRSRVPLPKNSSE